MENVRKPLSKKTSLVIVGVVVLALIVTAVAATVLMNGNDAPSGTSAPSATGSPVPEAIDYLKPSNPILIGESRYRSPCQIFPADTAAEIYGPFAYDTKVQETYFDTSSTESEVRSLCTYLNVGDKRGTVTLTAEQFASSEYGSSPFRVEERDFDEYLARYQTAVDASHNAEAEQMLETLKTSSATYKAFADSGYVDELETEGLILPGGILHLDDFEFVAMQGTTVYGLQHSLEGIVRSGEDHSDSEIIDALVRTKHAFEEIFKNDKNSELSQSPSPTLMAEIDRYGSTPIVEPCAVLTEEVFARIVGSPSSGPISRESVPYDLSKRVIREDKTVAHPGNSCGRELTVDKTTDRVTIDISYGEHLADAEAYVATEFVLSEGDIALETQADWATSFINQFEPDSRFVVFREGPYLVRVSVSQVFSEGLESDVILTDADQAQYVAAINEIVSSLNAFLEAK